MRPNENIYPHLVVTVDDERPTTPMTQAEKVLEANGIPHEAKTRYHLKIGSLNYYPATGSLHRDGETTAQKRVSLDDLLAIIRDEGV